MRILTFIIIVRCVVLSGFLNAQKNYLGIPPITTLESTAYDGNPQIWGLGEDAKGRIVICDQDISVFDGARWLKTPMSFVARCTFPRGERLYVGGDKQIGYLDKDSIGLYKYTSLSDGKLNQDRKEFWGVRRMVANGFNEVLFQEYNGAAFHIYDGALTHSFSTDTLVTTSFLYEGKFHVLTLNAGYIVENYKLKPCKLIPDSLIKKGVVFLCQSDTRLFFAIDRKLYVLKEGVLERFRTDSDEFFAKNDIAVARLFRDSLLVVGGLTKGIVMIDPSGEVLLYINQDKGLQGGEVQRMHIDRFDNIWLGHQNGISIVHMRSGLTQIDERLGFPKNLLLQAAPRFGSIIYLGSNTGIFEWDLSKNTNLLDPSYGCVERKDMVGQTWGSIIKRNKLLVCNNNTIFQIDKTGESTEIMDTGPWNLQVYNKDTSNIFACCYSGFRLLDFSIDSWREKKKFEGFTGNTRFSCQEDTTGFWTAERGTLHYLEMSHDGDSINVIQSWDHTNSSLPEVSVIWPKVFGDTVYFETIEGMYLYDRDIRDFVFSKYMNYFPGDTVIQRIREVENGDVWVSGFDQMSFMKKTDSGFVKHGTGFNILSNIPSQDIYPVDDQNIIVRAEDGCFHFNQRNLNEEVYTIDCEISKVFIGHEMDSLIFSGQLPDFIDKDGIEIEHELNFVKFLFAGNFPENYKQNRYQYQLIGVDRGWSSLSEKTEKEYTGLFEGTYEFQVRLTNVYKDASTIARYRFVILPPWYRSYPAYSVYLLLLSGVIYLIVRFNTKRLAEENRKLEVTIYERTSEIREQKDQLFEQNKKISDSISYARRIQGAILTSEEYLDRVFKDYFVFMRPRDVVSGDFYWMHETTSKKLVFTVADCTGHGIPGAFMSMIGVTLLNEIVLDKGTDEPNEILNLLRDGIIQALHQTGDVNETADGMDMAIAVFDPANMKLELAGAKNPVVMVRAGKANRYKGENQTISFPVRNNRPFTKTVVDLRSGDQIYLFSDGFPDQFGGTEGDRFQQLALMKCLSLNSNLPMPAQRTALEKVFNDWKGDYPQIDDICVFGYRIP